MLEFLFLQICVIETTRAVDGVIWSKSTRVFVPLFDVTRFASLNDERLEESRNLEWHDFGNESLRVAYYEETNLVSYDEKETRLSGVFGEVWETLAKYLNFTLVPVRMENRHFGSRLPNGSYDGVLGLIQSNQSLIIPRSGILSQQLSLVDFTVPLWKIRYYLYIIPEWSHDEAWMFHLFSVRVWYTFLGFLVLLSVAGYICEKKSVVSINEIAYSLQDHVFYTAAIACNQACIPGDLHNKSRLVYINTSLFSWLIFIAFSSKSILLMMNKKFVLPFADLSSLIQKSKYEVVAFRGSMVHAKFAKEISRYYRYPRDYRRVSYAGSAAEMFEKVCFAEGSKKFAAFEAEDRYRAIGKNICRLVPTEKSYFDIWVASAIKKGFRYKRTFDIGILKLSEFGIIDGLKDRWLNWKFDESEDVPFQSIDIGQIYLIFSILVLGLVLSIFILLFEHLTYFIDTSLKNKRKKRSKLKVNRKLLKKYKNGVYNLYK